MTVYRRAVDLMEAELGDELVALDPAAGTCFGFNEVATWIWRRLESPTNFDQLKAELLDEFDVEPDQCAAELHALLKDLVSRGLLKTAA